MRVVCKFGFLLLVFNVIIVFCMVINWVLWDGVFLISVNVVLEMVFVWQLGFRNFGIVCVLVIRLIKVMLFRLIMWFRIC